MRNLNGVMAILAGLSTAAVSRLKKTFQSLSSKTLKVLSLHQLEAMRSQELIEPKQLVEGRT